MADWWGESNNVLIPSLRENAKNKKQKNQTSKTNSFKSAVQNGQGGPEWHEILEE